MRRNIWESCVDRYEYEQGMLSEAKDLYSKPI